ncbi:hypothetical protein JTE90_003469 [Oedothorax gibbosus]|uniref:Uncharacterized protein n=1 Tax=Oedothorax gibbosus TaxID=931172 RepID=A0AAV6U2L0_9ARAC|nr:hypothetical protein JTE90_003469 [Oedothorax gibbosus]
MISQSSPRKYQDFYRTSHKVERRSPMGTKAGPPVWNPLQPPRRCSVTRRPVSSYSSRTHWIFLIVESELIAIRAPSSAPGYESSQQHQRDWGATTYQPSGTFIECFSRRKLTLVILKGCVLYSRFRMFHNIGVGVDRRNAKHSMRVANFFLSKFMEVDLKKDSQKKKSSTICPALSLFSMKQMNCLSGDII